MALWFATESWAGVFIVTLGRLPDEPPLPAALDGRGAHNDACFIVKDRNGYALAYVYYEEEPGRRIAANLLTKDEVRRRIAANVATAGFALEAAWLPGAVVKG